MEGLSVDNILGEQDIDNLFVGADYDPDEVESDEEDVEVDDEEASADSKREKKSNKTTEAVNPEELFDEEPESVGSGKDKEVKGQEDTATDEDSGTSPNNFYSSIANALAVDGIFPNLDEELIKKANSAESLSDLIEAEVNARLDDRQKRVAKALSQGVEPNVLRSYEATLNNLENITDAAIAEESEQGESLRRNLIYQDLINRGYTQEKARKLTERTINAGTDVDDAREALQSNKDYFRNSYNHLLKEAEDKAAAEKAELQRQNEKIKDSIMKDKQLFGDIEISKDMRRKVYENIAKPVYKDPETGDYLTAMQKYEMEHRGEFMKYAGLLFTLTNGFKDFESFTKGKVKKEVRKGLRELEHTLNTSRRNSDGSLRFVTGVNDDPESLIGKGIKFDF